MPEPTVTDHPDRRRFELQTDAGLARLDYRVEGDRLLLLHTEVPEDAGGQGLGGALVRAAFEQARADGRRVVPVCPFVHGWLERHGEEFAGMVDATR